MTAFVGLQEGVQDGRRSSQNPLLRNILVAGTSLLRSGFRRASMIDVLLMRLWPARRTAG